MRKKFLIQKKKQDTRNKKIKDFYPEQEKKDKEKEKIDSFEDIFF
ncbi:MAG: hypothetical protein KatS3mg002_0001 [Candidatus Woesearchaeota archaeon]|nr:MAG: hypothetical protein KatS3mg002_0001 [Candidatus Woesearchaeota archaeon]